MLAWKGINLIGGAFFRFSTEVSGASCDHLNSSLLSCSSHDLSYTCTNVSTQSARQYEAAFRQHYDNFAVADLGEPNRFGQDCYDATWILALALNNTLTGNIGVGSKLEV